MPQMINTNVASLNAQRNLTTSQSALSTSLQRLSSGMRINSAKDDAAGLAISDRFTSQIRGLNQATRNANDGISLAQTGEGALSEVNNNLQRIRELAVQASNVTNSSSDRAAIDLEVQQRMAEIDRIAAQTSFNGQKILNGTFGNAAFQVGANAGETIGLNLSTNTRISSVGAIATSTSQALGATASGGSVSSTTSVLTFGTAGAAQIDGYNTRAVGTLNYGTSAVAFVGGSNTGAASLIHAFGTADTPQVDGGATSTFLGVAGGGQAALDFSAALAQFDVDGTAITLTQAYGSKAALATDIQNQLQANSATAAYTAAFSGNDLVITNVGSTTAVAITNSDANAQAAGFVNTSGTAGSAYVAGTNASFRVNGNVVNLTSNYGSVAAVAAAIQGQLTGISVSHNGTGYVMTSTTSHNAVAVTANTSATAAAQAKATASGFQPSSGTAGVAAVSTTNAGFTVDGNAVSLTANYASYAALATAIQGQISGAGYTATASGTNITITKTGSLTAVALAGQTGAATTAGFIASAGTAGTAAVTSTNAQFTVDGNTVNLTANYASAAAMASAVQSQLTGYTVAHNGSTMTITNNTLASAAVVIGNPSNALGTRANAVGISPATGTAGAAGGSITLATGDFTIATGSNTAVDMSGAYTNSQALADAINSKVSNIYASINSNGSLTLTSANAVTLGGTRATASGAGNLAFASASITASSGSLSSGNTLTVASSNDLIQRVDSALGTVSTLRSTFGAIQNRLDSTIANLQTTAENLTASRSRIMDTDFAAETASLARSQILQQAGVAMLAQANALPNNVMALLRG